MTLSKAYALRLVKLLNDNKMTKYRFVKLTGLTHSTLRNIFNENNKDIKLSTIAKTANLFGLTLSEFFDCDIFNLDVIDFEV